MAIVNRPSCVGKLCIFHFNRIVLCSFHWPYITCQRFVVPTSGYNVSFTFFTVLSYKFLQHTHFLCLFLSLSVCLSFSHTHKHMHTHIGIFVLFLFFFFLMISHCSPGCPGTHSVVQAGLELRNLPASDFECWD